jgi:intracellular sulfur oxidation DsrE/DsrF family protein
MRTLATLIFGLTLAFTGPAHAAETPVKVVYDVSEGIAQAHGALRNITNHLNADPTAHIVVVARGAGIDLLLKDAKDPTGQAFEPLVKELAAKGVEFRACNNSLKGRNLGADAVIPEATVVPSGVAELARLQSREGYAYIHP